MNNLIQQDPTRAKEILMSTKKKGEDGDRMLAMMQAEEINEQVVKFQTFIQEKRRGNKATGADMNAQRKLARIHNLMAEIHQGYQSEYAE